MKKKKLRFPQSILCIAASTAALVGGTTTFAQASTTSTPPSALIQGNDFPNGEKVYLYSHDGSFTEDRSYVNVRTHLTEHIFVYTVHRGGELLGYLTLTEDQIDNGDWYYLMHFEPKTTQKYPFNVILNIDDSSKSAFIAHYNTYPNISGEDNSPPPVAHPAVTLGTTLPKTTTMLWNGSTGLIMSQTNVYTALGHGTYDFHPDLVPTNTYSKSGSFVMHFPVERGLVDEQWGVVSTNSLLDWSNPAIDKLYTNDVMDGVVKWTGYGPLCLTYSSYAPYTPTAYWFKPANYMTISYIGDQPLGRAFYDMSYVLLYKSLELQGPNGYFLSTPESDWLHGAYGFGYGFYDTRFNTDFHDFLLNYEQQHGVDSAVDNNLNAYIHFLEGYAQTNSTKVGDGIVVSDYMDPLHPSVKTHTSLNHDLAEMDFLYDVYLNTNDAKAKLLADEYKAGIDAIGTKWVKPDHDLYYQRNLDGTFSGLDYPNLTLHDLEKSQTLFVRVFGSEDRVFTQLIDSKKQYCEANHIPE